MRSGRIPCRKNSAKKTPESGEIAKFDIGKGFPATFHVADSADEADIIKRDVTFLYTNRGEFWFCDPEDKSKRFKLDAVLIGNAEKF